MDKRYRTVGTFICYQPDCGKSFTRHDHLLRHQRNHDPKQRLPCPWVGCEAIFTRSDVRDKHYRRHIDKLSGEQSERVLLNETSMPISKTADTSSVPITESSVPVTKSSIPATESSRPITKTSVPNNISAIPPSRPSTGTKRTRSDSVPSSTIPITVSNVISPSTWSELPAKYTAQNASFPSELGQQSTTQTYVPTVTDNPPPDPLSLSGKSMGLDAGLSPSDLIEWLFDDIQNHQDFPGVSPLSPMSLLETMFALSPNFPHSNNRKSVDKPLRLKLVNLIPSLDQNPDFSVANIERWLEIYWLIFHPQYPILHRPSFSNSDSHPLLLLAMIMVGASLWSCTGSRNSNGVKDPDGLAEQIAIPLRWLIFADSDCKPPAKVWVIQSLLMLETFEITSTSRALHERAYLHHGTKIQLLRRSPTLGGDPLKDDTEDLYLPPNHVWKKWIEDELMKRATLMAFYLDTVNATVYGHTIVLYAHQIKLSLPCEDELWEFDNTKRKLEAIHGEKPPKFLVALRKLLHRQKVKTSTFGRKILLAGLLTIMFQMQQKDLQLLFLEWNQMRDSWNETISLAIDVWKTDICDQGCCNTENSLNFSEEDRKILPPMLRIDDNRCKFSLYHISQIYMRITHYDYIIFAGAPSRMNVKAGEQEYAVVSQRVSEWAHSINGGISVCHAYLFLCEMLLSPTNEDITYSYDPNTDPFLHRKNIIISAVLVVFAYNFTMDGPESDLFLQLEYYPDKEDGYSYLKRIRSELCRYAPFHTPLGKDYPSFHSDMKLLGKEVGNIKDKHHMVGLLKMFYKSFSKCKWEVGREYSKLIRNCIERCLGSKKVVCENMYESN